MDGGPPGSPVPGILQARTLEWVAISFSYEQLYGNKIGNLEEMDRFWEKFNLSRLKQEEIEIMAKQGPGARVCLLLALLLQQP